MRREHGTVGLMIRVGACQTNCGGAGSDSCAHDRGRENNQSQRIAPPRRGRPVHLKLPDIGG